MKGPKFNAKLTLANQTSDVNLARIIATAQKAGVNESELRLMGNVLRPFVHELNYAQSENRDPVQLNEGLASLVASMYIELMSRVVPTGEGNATLISTFTQDFIEDVNVQIVMAVNSVYHAGLVLGDPAPPPGATN